jgi:DNA-binding protein Alba
MSESEKTEKEMVPVVLVGKRPVMSYVFSAVTLFDKGFNEVTFKARGLSIKRAIDAVEILKRQFVKDIKSQEVKIGTEQAPNPADGTTGNVSFIEIILRNK